MDRDLGKFTIANALNNLGVVVGSLHLTNGDTHAFLWSGGKLTDLGTLPGFHDASAASINDFGQIVGSSGPRAGFIYFHKTMYNLEDLLAPGTLFHSINGGLGFGWVFSPAVAINNRGQIIINGHHTLGTGQPGDTTSHPAILNPSTILP